MNMQRKFLSGIELSKESLFQLSEHHHSLLRPIIWSGNDYSEAQMHVYRRVHDAESFRRSIANNSTSLAVNINNPIPGPIESFEASYGLIPTPECATRWKKYLASWFGVQAGQIFLAASAKESWFCQCVQHGDCDDPDCDCECEFCSKAIMCTVRRTRSILYASAMIYAAVRVQNVTSQILSKCYSETLQKSK